MQHALTGIRVLDLSRVLAGPWATQIMGGLGAEVIKIEKPDSGDDTRSWGPPWHGQGVERQSAYFLSANRNKKSVVIDITAPAGQDIIRKLVQSCDVLVENFKVGDLARYGLDQLSLRKINPRLIYCSITGFGQTGPRASEAGYDFMIQGLSGLMNITGEPTGEPQKVGVALIDVMTGLYATIAMLAAINQRHVTGEGQYIDVALFDVGVSTLANQALNFLVSGEEPQRLGNAHPNIVPYQVFATSDGYLVLAIGNDAQFARFAALSERTDLSDSPYFRTNADRVANRAALVKELAPIIAGRTSAEWRTLLRAVGIPHGPINKIGEALSDPQIVHRRLVRTDDGVPGLAIPLQMSASPFTGGSRPPHLNEHFGEVMEKILGLSGDQVAQLLTACGGSVRPNPS